MTSHILYAFNALNQHKRDNLVSLTALRVACYNLTREQFDAALHSLRLNRVLTLSGAEGRYGITDADRAAAIYEHGDVLLYVSRVNQS